MTAHTTEITLSNNTDEYTHLLRQHIHHSRQNNARNYNKLDIELCTFTYFKTGIDYIK